VHGGATPNVVTQEAMHAVNTTGKTKPAPVPQPVQHTPQHAPPAIGPAFACINRLTNAKSSETNDICENSPLILKLC
jgi:hypothetical protein